MVTREPGLLVHGAPTDTAAQSAALAEAQRQAAVATEAAGRAERALTDALAETERTKNDLAEAVGWIESLIAERDEAHERLGALRQDLATANARLGFAANETSALPRQLDGVRADAEGSARSGFPEQSSRTENERIRSRPVVGQPSDHNESGEPPAEPGGTLRIGICEDDPLVRSVVGGLVRAASHDVVGEADNAIHARQIALAADADVIIADLMGVGGADPLRELDFVARRYRIVVFSAIAHQLDRLPPGVVAIQKPDFEQLGAHLAGLGPEPGQFPRERRRSSRQVVVGPARRSGPWDEPADFYAALETAEVNDILVVCVPPDRGDLEALGIQFRRLIRAEDRMLGEAGHVVLLLRTPNGGVDQIVIERLRAQTSVAGNLTFNHVVLNGEVAPFDAFAELRPR